MDRTAFRTEVTTHMVGLLSRVDTFVSSYMTSDFDPGPAHQLGRLKQRLYDVADTYATLLEVPEEQEEAAYTLCEVMFADQEPPREFWTGEAGRAIALAIGYPRPHVPRATVEHILGFSRQRVYELILKGRLDAAHDEDGKQYVTAGSVRAFLRKKVSGAA